MSDRLLIFTGPSPRGWHRIGQFLECPQKYAWAYEAGDKGHRAPTGPIDEATPLVRGSLIHLGLAQHYAQMREYQQGRDPASYYDPEEAMRIVADAKGEAYQREVDEMVKCVAAYQDHWHSEDFKVLRVEELYEGTFEGYPLTGRLDLVIEDKAGRVFVMDHKSTGFLSAKQRTFYSISGQMHAYRWLASMQYGERLGGMRVNMIQHTNGYKFQRFDLDPAPHMFTQFPRIIREAEEQIAAYKAEGRAPQMWPMAVSELTCFHRYGACEHMDKCKWGRA
jgi:hypothetical protein